MNYNIRPGFDSLTGAVVPNSAIICDDPTTIPVEPRNPRHLTTALNALQINSNANPASSSTQLQGRADAIRLADLPDVDNDWLETENTEIKQNLAQTLWFFKNEMEGKGFSFKDMTLNLACYEGMPINTYPKALFQYPIQHILFAYDFFETFLKEIPENSNLAHSITSISIDGLLAQPILELKNLEIFPNLKSLGFHGLTLSKILIDNEKMPNLRVILFDDYTYTHSFSENIQKKLSDKNLIMNGTVSLRIKVLHIVKNIDDFFDVAVFPERKEMYDNEDLFGDVKNAAVQKNEDED